MVGSVKLTEASVKSDTSLPSELILGRPPPAAVPYREGRAGCTAQTVDILVGHAREKTFVSTARNFCSDHVRLKCARFSRGDRKYRGDTSEPTPVGSTGPRCTERTGDRRPRFYPAVLLTRAGSTTFLRDGPDRRCSVSVPAGTPAGTGRSTQL